MKPEVIVVEPVITESVKPEAVVAELPSLEYLPPVEAKPEMAPVISEVVTTSAAPEISAPATTVPTIVNVEIQAPSLEYLPPQAVSARKIRSLAAWRTN